ncbi:hypothetical protein BDY19DRAFT_997378 [Irpex rosettiformis]|uniref:Uncharacterized protein n=1 Tax=Irpex rosettiformis TaxID=378272 RepID=A0ACB8TRZ2_9APHY|nr:hypothetical protein BDY19DRAFT_997378 [Irpex rosettiformis]
MLFTKIVTLSSLFTFALAAPFVPEVVEKRDVVAPKMTSPTASTIWQAGQTYQVTWDTSGLPPPANITNKIGQVILGQFDANGDEHLQFNTPLAKDFPITSGSVDLVAPNVPTGKYFLVLFGDSGNNGPTFTIENGSVSSSSSTSATPSTAATSSSSETVASPTESKTSGSLPSPSLSGPLSDPSTLSESSAPISVSSTPLSSASSAPSSSLSFSASISRSISSPLPSSSGNSSSATQQTSSSTSWVRTDSCLMFAAAALSAVLLLA